MVESNLRYAPARFRGSAIHRLVLHRDCYGASPTNRKLRPMRARLLISLLRRVYAGVSLKDLPDHYGAGAEACVVPNLG